MSGEHGHPELEHPHPFAPAAHGHGEYADAIRDLLAAGAALRRDLDALAGRVSALEPVEELPFVADFHVAGDGDDSRDGLTRATAWKSVGKAPADRITALWDGGTITGAAIYDRAVHLVTAPGVHAVIGGYMAGTAKAKHTLRLQRAHGSTIHAGAGGSITVTAPLDPGESVSATGEKPGLVRRAAVELTDCDDLDLDFRVVAGTDFGILTAGTLRRCRVVADVSDAGHGFMLKGNLGTGDDRSWFGGHAHDCNRMVRNLRNPTSSQGAYGAVGFVNENATGGGLLEGWQATNCHAPCFQYGFDGCGLEGYDGVGFVVRPGTVTDCEGGFETGGSAGKGIHAWSITGLKIRGQITRNGKSPAILIRNFEGSTLDCDVDVTSARVALEVYPDAGQFGGSIANSAITGRIVERPGVPPMSVRDLPASTLVDVQVVVP